MPSSRPHFILLDNGSLEPAAVLSLRRIAEGLSQELGTKVDPISLLHSHKIPAEKLGGIPAETFDRGMKARTAAGETDFLVIPLFFGPSGALTDYLPERIALLKNLNPQLQVCIAPCLVDPADDTDERLAAILEDNIQSTIHSLPTELPPPAAGSPPPTIILVDHGSPKHEVTAVRNHLAKQLRHRLSEREVYVMPASMERRPEAEYDFNEPLLERAFDQLPMSNGTVIISMLFLSPGRHAGPRGDIARICAAARERHPHIQTFITPLVGEHPGLIPLLAARANQTVTKPIV